MRCFTLLFALLAAPLLSGCGVIHFDVERDIPEQEVQGNLATMLLGGLIDNPIPMEIDLEQETAARDAGVACEARLTELTFRITGTAQGAGDEDDFDFVDRITIFVESRRSSSTLPRELLAELDPVPEGATTLSVRPTDLDLLPYVEEGAAITASASGSPPPDDVTFDGHYVVEVEAL